MTPNVYQMNAHTFATYGGNINYPLLGLSEECGEALGKVAKFIRKHDGHEPHSHSVIFSDQFPDEWNQDNDKFLVDFKKELGDVCWMVAELCTAFGFELEDVMDENIAKLTDRKERNVIVGEGDNR